MRRLAWTFAARIGDKYQIRLARPRLELSSNLFNALTIFKDNESYHPGMSTPRQIENISVSLDDWSNYNFVECSDSEIEGTRPTAKPYKKCVDLNKVSWPFYNYVKYFSPINKTLWRKSTGCDFW